MVEGATDQVISAFTEDQVKHLTGISKRRLHYWDNTGFFTPSLASKNRRSPFSRLYSFRDVVSLKVLASLRDEANVSLPHLREVKQKLAHLGDDLWSKTTLYVLNKRVVFDNPETQALEEIVSGQGVLQIPLKVVTSNMLEAVRVMKRREATTFGKTERHRSIANNQVVIAGTRIPVKSIRAFHEAGYSFEAIKKEYPSLTDDDIRVAIASEAAA